jgi:hypothetical protein
MEPQDYDDGLCCCPECLDVAMIFEVVWSTGEAQLQRYTCPACGYVWDFLDEAPDLNGIPLIPPYDS